MTRISGLRLEGGALPIRTLAQTVSSVSAGPPLGADSVSVQTELPPAESASEPTVAEAPSEPRLSAHEVRESPAAPGPSEVDGFMLADAPPSPVAFAAAPLRTAGLPADLPPGADSNEVAEWCGQVAHSALSAADRAALISPVLADAVQRAESPSSDWVKATPKQISLYVQETIEHADAVQRVGALRGQDWSRHDLEGQTSKFQPEIAQFLALPGRDESVKWAIGRHNSAEHHARWKDPQARPEDLDESASDIVNAWRMNRRVYDSPSWSWERILRFIEVGFQNNEMSATQRDALLAAVPFQMEEERQNGIPA